VARRGVDPADSGELAELRVAFAREERIARALQEVGTALGATLELDHLLELILDRLTELLEAERSTLYLLDEVTGDLMSRIVVGQDVRSIRLKVGHGIAGTVAKHGKPIRIRDAYNDPRFEPEWDLLTGFKTTNMLAVPLKSHQGRTIGVIQVLNKKTAVEFTVEDEAILSALSMQAAVAIDNARLFLSLGQKNRQLLETKVQLEHRVKDLELLFDLERATARAASVDDLVKAALQAAATASESRGAGLLVVEEGSGDLIEYVLDADLPDELDRFGIKNGEGFLAQTMAEQGSYRVSVARAATEKNERVEGRFRFPVESFLGLPLEDEASPLGALGVFTKRNGRSFNDQDEGLLALVTANVSTALRLFRASAARERSERLTSIGRLLSQVIHDFKTPMTVISGYVQLLVGIDDKPQREAYSKEILKQFEVLTAMQREVLEFARGEKRVFVRRVYLHAFMTDMRQQIEREIEGKNITLRFEIDTKVVARFDEGRMARAIHNLARNAIEAMADGGGLLTVRAGLAGLAGEEGDMLFVSVSDTGPGIPPEVEGRLFQSFVTAGKRGGTGLGLAIVKKIVEEHGGTVSVHSTTSGATFELRLPQTAARAPGTVSLPPKRPRPPAPAGKSKAIPRKRKVRKGRASKNPQ
jgi:signal transduction histidine kinase/putative methionine-R-sulfoxide reductase with GAF domain